MKNKKLRCCLCRAVIENPTLDSNNAEPLARGRCCSKCNINKVVPARLREIGVLK